MSYTLNRKISKDVEMKRTRRHRSVAETHANYGVPGGEIVLYRAKDGMINLDVRLERETIWLTQKQMADLFGKDTDTIGLHIRNIFREREVDEASTTEDSSVVQSEGGRAVRRQVRFYSLDVIISVGYRVNSKRGTEFRIWATRVLRDHILKGYTINERQLRKQVARLKELQATVDLLGRVMQERRLAGEEAEVRRSTLHGNIRLTHYRSPTIYEGCRLRLLPAAASGSESALPRQGFMP